MVTAPGARPRVADGGGHPLVVGGDGRGVDDQHGVDVRRRRRPRPGPSVKRSGSASFDRSTGSAGSSPHACRASTASHAGPHELVTTATRLPGGQRLVGQHAGRVEHLREVVDADHAGLLEQRRRGGVGRPALGLLPAVARRAADLDRHHRLAARQGPGRAGELRRVAERLQVEHGHVGARGRPASTGGGRCPTRRPCCRRPRTTRCRGPTWRAPSMMAAPIVPDWAISPMRPASGSTPHERGVHAHRRDRC